MVHDCTVARVVCLWVAVGMVSGVYSRSQLVRDGSVAFPDTHIVVCTMYVVLNGLDAKMNLVMCAGVWCTFFFHTLILMFTSMYCVRIQYRSPLYLVDLTSGSVLHLDSITTRA